MVLQLNGHPRSAASHRVCVVMLAMGLQRDKDFELGTFDFKSIKEPAWREKQPFGQMPYMDDTENDITTYESRAMVRYLAAKHNSPLLITQKDGLKAYADFETACSAEAANFDEHARTIVNELMFAPIFGNQPNQALVEHHKKILEENLKAFDQILKDRKYMAGDQLTIVDFFYLPIGSFLVETGAVPSMTDGSLPNFTRWWESMVNTQEWQFIQRFIALALSQGLGDM